MASRAPEHAPEPIGLVRERLDSALFAAHGPRICLVTAPAGSGKSTLLAHVASAAQLPVAWFHARPEERGEADLVRRMGTSLGMVPTPSGGAARHTEDLLQHLGSTVTPSLIVIDDLHVVAASQAEAAIADLLLRAPPRVRFILATRRPPTFDISRLLASGDLAEFGSDDLRFRSWEVEDLFRAVYHEPLSPEAAALLTRRLGGWAAGLQLFHLSVKDRSRTEREASVTKLTGRCKLIRSYLSRNVVNGLPAERRRFLLHTSVLGVLTGPLCDALLGSAGSDQILRDLEREHFFTSSEDGLTYVYHQVLRNHLEVSLAEELSPEEFIQLLLAAGVLLEDAGYVQASARAFAQAGDWASVGRVIQQSRSLVTLDVDWAWDSPLAATTVSDDPWLALARARRLFQRGSLLDAVAAFREVEEMFDDPEARQRCAIERAMAAMLLPHSSDRMPAHATLHRVLGGIRGITRSIGAQQDTSELPVADAELLQGIALLLAGDWDRAEQRVVRAAGASATRSWERMAAGIVGAIVECRSPSGSDPTRPLEEVSLAADLEEFPWLARVARGLQASVVVVLSGQNWRLDGCRDVVDSCRRDGDTWGELIVSLGVAVAALRVGDDEAGATWLASAKKTARSLNAPVLGVWVEAIAQARRESMGHGEGPRGWEALRRTAGDLGIDFEEVCRLVRKIPALRPPAPALLPSPDDGVVTVRCLGGFSIETPRGGVQLTSLRPRARMLLMALALHHERGVHRERLREMLWPGVEAAKANHSLQVAVSSVRRLLTEAGLGTDPVHRRADSYRLQIDRATVDLDCFEEGVRGHTRYPGQPAASRSLDQALTTLDLYTGDLLPEAGYAEWVVLERDRVRQIAAGYAVEVAGLCLSAARHARGVETARRAIELDPYQDSAWIVLTRLQEEVGDHTAAALTRSRHNDIRDMLDVRAPSAAGVPGAGWRGGRSLLR